MHLAQQNPRLQPATKFTFRRSAQHPTKEFYFVTRRQNTPNGGKIWHDTIALQVHPRRQAGNMWVRVTSLQLRPHGYHWTMSNDHLWVADDPVKLSTYVERSTFGAPSTVLKIIFHVQHHLQWAFVTDCITSSMKAGRQTVAVWAEFSDVF